MSVDFKKYKKSDDKARVLLLYLILNNYDLSRIEDVIEVVQERMFGVEFHKIFGITNEFVDIKRIEEELAEIHTPVICSPQSYEIYSTAETIHIYHAREEDKPLFINDMGVISPLMVINENCIVSSKLAASVESSDECGFMYFVDYVLKGEIEIGDWHIIFKDKEFSIYYAMKGFKDDKEEVHNELLYHAIELDQTSTFKLVLYIIKKVMEEICEFPPDNFVEETWKLENKK